MEEPHDRANFERAKEWLSETTRLLTEIANTGRM